MAEVASVALVAAEVEVEVEAGVEEVTTGWAEAEVVSKVQRQALAGKGWFLMANACESPSCGKQWITALLS